MADLAIEEIDILEVEARFEEIVERVRATGRPIRVTENGVAIVEIVPRFGKTVPQTRKAEA